MESNTANTTVPDDSTTDTVPDYSRVWEIIHSAFLVLVIITAVLGNGFVCAAVFRFRRLQKPSNYFLVSLAASDILVALFALPFRIYFELDSAWQLGKHTCQFWIFVDLLCSSASIVNLSLVSVDRYISLSRALRYLVIMTVRRCTIGIMSVWLFSFVNAILSLHTWSKDGSLQYREHCLKLDKVYYTTSTILGILLPLTVLIVLYCLVFKMALEQRKKIYQSAVHVGSLQETGDDPTADDPSRHGINRRHFAIKELKATKALIIVVGTFLVCWLPFIVIALILQHSPTHFAKLPDKTQEILGQLFLYTLPPLNSALNPFIYTYFNSDFRKVFKDTLAKLLPCLARKSTRDTISVTSGSRV